ncbi:Peptidase C48, SUMO/Sentrin/Ubl1 [Penicillium expansum]|uniref:Peptidase C48, SUMO/Sentrin/Ubl1 n=1 Tax=Penicillium expansum TaxID=27334 RepID=A0A0A2JRT8_PENEN|nr:Peptidase C48, SUMO/Sentrin/Ubl1 [Penicillium expansum]KGO43406.1 Peptidase C48, SUMO/Sentrin/Ubl1 [Penicillium expansum]KGO57368.1 Peptidase C48, SUMO/Sentrin/Ubl1 [Penicillium expansum]KGO71555.1 Peptidase C48, SUMO/Sentrin/Ubl1 [Penicillium expansum]
MKGPDDDAAYLLDLFSNLSPRRQRETEDRRSAVERARPPPSTPPRSRPAGSSRNPFALLSDEINLTERTSPQNAGIAPLPTAVHSYVDTFSSPTGSTTADEPLRPRFPHPFLSPITRLDMSHRNPQRFPAGRQKLIPPPISRQGDSSQMLNKDQQKDSQNRQDEARLLGARYPDSNAVKIKPGAFHSRNKKPGANFAFSPANKLSQNARSSGPVRSSGGSNQQPPRRKSHHFEEEFEESSRPTKIRRQSETSETIDLTAPANPAIGQLEQGPTPFVSHQNAARRNRHEDPRDAEHGVKVAQSPIRPQHAQFSSADSRDERFTETAAQQRRDQARSKAPRLYQPNGKANQTSEAIVIGSIETGPKRTGRNRTAVPSTSIHRPANGRESPDELQGDITTHQVPRSFSGTQSQTTRPSNPGMDTESPTRKRSPSDAQTPDLAPPSPATKKPKISQKGSDKKHILRYFRTGSFGKSCDKMEYVPIYSNKEGLELREDVLGQGNTISIPFHQIRQIFTGEPPSRKVRIRMLQNSVQADDQLDVEFWTTEEKLKLLEVLNQANDKVQRPLKEMKWMDKAFLKYEKQFPLENQLPKKRILDDLVEDPDPAHSPPPSRRPKLSKSLRDDQGEVNNVKLREIKRTAQEKGKYGNGIADCRTSTKKQDDSRPLDTDTAVDVRSTANPLERETRYSTRRVTNKPDLSNGDNTSEAHSDSLLRDDSFRRKWKKPLVYPRNGKKKAEVTLGDRERLLRDDFLNDNLIALYMRFLQDHLERTNKEAAKRIYFFNTYLFATLTNTPRGDRGINYSGVEKWTRNVDLFSYDYIVVPINENAHWYVAIICNLPSLSLGFADGAVEPVQTPTLQKESSNASESEIQEIEETPEPEPKLKSEPNASDKASQPCEIRKGSETRKDLASLQIEKNEHAIKNPKQSVPDDTPLPAPNLSKFAAQKLAQEQAAASQPTNKSKKKRTGLKLDPNQTTIITFDSLDMPRSPTIKILREYICREAVSKRNVELDPTDVKGMRARDIPLQPNFWDCGLYLLAYLEKFVQSPDWFITKVLQRSMNSNDDWPPLGSGLLRYRLGKFLDELYEEQRQADEPVMAARQPVSFLLGPPLPCQEELPDVDVVPESQHETDPSEDPSKTSNSKIEDSSEDSTADQMHLLPTAELLKPPKASPDSPADTKSQPHHIAPPREEPIIQVPGSQEEPEEPGTPTPTRKERRKQSPRGPSRKR